MEFKKLVTLQKGSVDGIKDETAFDAIRRFEALCRYRPESTHTLVLRGLRTKVVLTWIAGGSLKAAATPIINPTTWYSRHSPAIVHAENIQEVLKGLYHLATHLHFEPPITFRFGTDQQFLTLLGGQTQVFASHEGI